MVYASSTTYLFTRLQKTFSSCEPKEDLELVTRKRENKSLTIELVT